MTTHPGARPISDWVSLATLVACWGSTFAFTKVALETIPPLWVVSIRLLIGLAAILLILAGRGERMPRGLGIWAWLSLVGALAIIPFSLISWGTQHIDTGLAGILFGIGPLVTIALAHFFVPGERMTLARAGGFALGFCGLVVLIGPDAISGLGGDATELLAQFAMVGAASGYALQAILARLMPDISPFQKSAGAFLVAALASVPLAMIAETRSPFDASARSLLATACMGLLATGLASIVMFRLISGAGPTFLSLVSYLLPLFTLAVGVTLMGETVEARALAALALIVCGIALGEFGRSRAPTKPARHDP